MKYLVEIVTTNKVVIEAENDYDILNKVQKIAENSKASDYGFVKIHENCCSECQHFYRDDNYQCVNGMCIDSSNFLTY